MITISLPSLAQKIILYKGEAYKQTGKTFFFCRAHDSVVIKKNRLIFHHAPDWCAAYRKEYGLPPFPHIQNDSLAKIEQANILKHIEVNKEFKLIERKERNGKFYYTYNPYDKIKREDILKAKNQFL